VFYRGAGLGDGRKMTPARGVQQVDVVTTATFGAYVFLGALSNFGHTTAYAHGKLTLKQCAGLWRSCCR